MTKTFTCNWPPTFQLSFKRGYFLQKWLFFQLMMHLVWTPVRMWICIQLRTVSTNWELKKKAFTVKRQNMKQSISNWKLSFKKNIFQKNITFFQLEMRPFCAPIRMEMCLRMPQYKNWKEKHLWQKIRIQNKQLAYKWLSSWKLSFKKKIFWEI